MRAAICSRSACAYEMVTGKRPFEGRAGEPHRRHHAEIQTAIRACAMTPPRWSAP